MKHDLSQMNAAIVRSLFDAFGRADTGAVLALCSPEVEWNVQGDPKDFPVFGLRKGLAGVESFLRDVAATHRFSLFDPAEMHADREHVYVTVRFVTTMPKSVRELASEFLVHFELAGGKIRRMREYLDTAAFIATYRS